ncbi:hypothetical protein PR202_ga15280 [Eleusine coracana subsp. coracana]|uniref:Uncharacterized protein n=1 Tax=Eleusine coracana subsp. coracana TaxID=191504 RepID=A0AAV5CIM7_ELECO|nr:hypothetical protein PR202_ga15280 [Eleusine coracana subsp. coracana]
MGLKCLVVAAVVLVVTVVGLVLRGVEKGTRAGTNVLISGIVPCSTGSTIDMAAAPAFAHASLQLECGGKMVAGATTDDAGAFQINLGIVGTDLLINGLLFGRPVQVGRDHPAGRVQCVRVPRRRHGDADAAPLKLLGTDDGSYRVGGLGRVVVQAGGGFTKIAWWCLLRLLTSTRRLEVLDSLVDYNLLSSGSEDRPSSHPDFVRSVAYKKLEPPFSPFAILHLLVLIPTCRRSGKAEALAATKFAAYLSLVLQNARGAKIAFVLLFGCSLVEDWVESLVFLLLSGELQILPTPPIPSPRTGSLVSRKVFEETPRLDSVLFQCAAAMVPA